MLINLIFRKLTKRFPALLNLASICEVRFVRTYILALVASMLMMMNGCYENPVSPPDMAQISIKLEFPEAQQKALWHQFPEHRNSLEELTALGIQQVDSLTATVFKFDNDITVPVIEGKELEIKEETINGFRREYFEEVLEIPVSKADERFFIFVQAFIFSRLFLFGEASFTLSPDEVREEPIIIKLARTQ